MNGNRIDSNAIVDIHCHIFNGEDLPIDGFLRKRFFKLPDFLVAALAKPLEKLVEWATPGTKEKQALLAMLAGQIEIGKALEESFTEASVTQDEVLTLMHQSLIPGGRAESFDSPSQFQQLTTVISTLSETEQQELEDWATEFGDPSDLESSRALVKESFNPREVLLAKLLGPVGRLIVAIKTIMNPRYKVAAKLAGIYKECALFTPALVDFEIPAEDAPSTRIRDQLVIHSLLSKLAIVGRLPNSKNVRIHSFIGFDPFREIRETSLGYWRPHLTTPNPYMPYNPGSTLDEHRYHEKIRFDPQKAAKLNIPAGDWNSAVVDVSRVRGSFNLVRNAIEIGGYIGVKLYPPAGFLPLGNKDIEGWYGKSIDAALRSLYAYCERMEVPILAHSSNSNAFNKGYGEYAGPKGWAAVLKDYPKLRLCLGHFGHMEGITDPKVVTPKAWVWGFVELIDSHDNVYADVGNSKFRYDTAYRTHFLELLDAVYKDSQKKEKRMRRIIYGSDWWMNTLEPKHDNFLTSFQHYYGTRFGNEPLANLMGRNALRFLGFTKEDGSSNADNLNRKRLVSFYGPHPRPTWLS